MHLDADAVVQFRRRPEENPPKYSIKKTEHQTCTYPVVSSVQGCIQVFSKQPCHSFNVSLLNPVKDGFFRVAEKQKVSRRERVNITSGRGAPGVLAVRNDSGGKGCRSRDHTAVLGARPTFSGSANVEERHTHLKSSRPSLAYRVLLTGPIDVL